MFVSLSIQAITNPKCTFQWLGQMLFIMVTTSGAFEVWCLCTVGTVTEAHFRDYVHRHARKHFAYSKYAIGNSVLFR
jgi:isoprenylcysteine carboxyl methyltransferase (ICMT) family protein YpbQ